MADFNYVEWGNTKIVGHWVLESGESGIYRGQCTQVPNQLLKDLGYPAYAAARGNGNQVGPNMVVRGEAAYVGTNLSSVPTNELHVICKDVGNTSTAGHVSVAAVGDIVFEQNVNGSVTHDYGVGPTYPGRLGRLSEAWRGNRYHYKITVDTDYDNVSGDDGGGDPDETDGPNQNRFIKGNTLTVKRSKTAPNNAVRNHKFYYAYPRTERGVPQG